MSSISKLVAANEIKESRCALRMLNDNVTANVAGSGGSSALYRDISTGYKCAIIKAADKLNGVKKTIFEIGKELAEEYVKNASTIFSEAKKLRDTMEK